MSDGGDKDKEFHIDNEVKPNAEFYRKQHLYLRHDAHIDPRSAEALPASLYCKGRCRVSDGGDKDKEIYIDNEVKLNAEFYHKQHLYLRHDVG